MDPSFSFKYSLGKIPIEIRNLFEVEIVVPNFDL